MRTRTGRLMAISLALVFTAVSGAAKDLPQYKELPNFHQVSEHLYRGAQPKPGGVGRLASLGIKTIIDLRAADENSRAEEAEAKAAGLRFFSVPMAGVGRPAEAQVERILAIINAPENQPVFVHCRRGADRTGTIIACYRISHDGWTPEQAQQEASKYGMGWWEFGMKDYLRKLDRGRARSAENHADNPDARKPAGARQ
jgi:tyrosine-protein phosphatase SIW14